MYGGKQEQKAPSPTGCPYCDGKLDFEQENTVKNAKNKLGMPNIELNAGVGATIGSSAGGYISGAGGPVGAAVGIFVDSFDWEWYQQYREIAAPIEREYSGRLP